MAEPHAPPIEPPNAQGVEARQPLLVCHALAGDLLMSVPALRALLDRFGPAMRLVCGHEPEHQRVFQLLGFTQILSIPFVIQEPPTPTDETLKSHTIWTFDIDAVTRFAQGCDLYINLTDSDGSCFDQLGSQLNLPSVGYHITADTFIDPYGVSTKHSIDLHFDMVRACWPQAYLGNYAYFAHRPDAPNIRSLVRQQVGEHRLVVLHADTKLEKMWPLDRWAAWLQCLWQAEPETRVVLVGYPALPLECYATDKRLIDCRDLPLTVNYEIVAMADLFVGIDSCMVHAADLCRVPSVGLFTHKYPPSHVGLRFADGQCVVGDNPPLDVNVQTLWQAYCQVKDRQW